MGFVQAVGLLHTPWINTTGGACKLKVWLVVAEPMAAWTVTFRDTWGVAP